MERDYIKVTGVTSSLKKQVKAVAKDHGVTPSKFVRGVLAKEMDKYPDFVKNPSQ